MKTIAFNKSAANVLVWVLLLAAPFWLPFVGGYTELGERIVVLGLAAMSVNFLLGYTGVLSFGQMGAFLCPSVFSLLLRVTGGYAAGLDGLRGSSGACGRDPA